MEFFYLLFAVIGATILSLALAELYDWIENGR